MERLSSLNTGAFRSAIDRLKVHAGAGGSQLNVPEGRWVTGSFNLTSHFTLYLEQRAVILGSQDPREWPIIEALPSYGRGRERVGGRHISLIHGDDLEDVVITGQNASIDGQGRMWWDLCAIELWNTQEVISWNCNVVIKGLTILSPLNSPNTDGIDPDSSSHVCIEECYIESGDDLVAIKSGWDQYGIAMARPSSDIIVRKVSGTTPTCSGVAIGSEMSGGIANVLIEDLHVQDSAAGIRLKTDRGRRDYIWNISITNMQLVRVKTALRFSRGANDHPDNEWDPKALPVVRGVSMSNVVGVGIGRAPVLEGLQDAPFHDICIKNVTMEGIPDPAAWHCEFISGSAVEVSPLPCPELQPTNASQSWCGPG